MPDIFCNDRFWQLPIELPGDKSGVIMMRVSSLARLIKRAQNTLEKNLNMELTKRSKIFPIGRPSKKDGKRWKAISMPLGSCAQKRLARKCDHPKGCGGRRNSKKECGMQSAECPAMISSGGKLIHVPIVYLPRRRLGIPMTEGEKC
jgi:hypothetical protein